MAKAARTGEKKRTSFIVHTDTVKKIKYIAFMEDKDITEVVDESFREKIERYEKKNGTIRLK